MTDATLVMLHAKAAETALEKQLESLAEPVSSAGEARPAAGPPPRLLHGGAAGLGKRGHRAGSHDSAERDNNSLPEEREHQSIDRQDAGPPIRSHSARSAGCHGQLVCPCSVLIEKALADKPPVAPDPPVNRGANS